LGKPHGIVDGEAPLDVPSPLDQHREGENTEKSFGMVHDLEEKPDVTSQAALG